MDGDHLFKLVPELWVGEGAVVRISDGGETSLTEDDSSVQLIYPIMFNLHV